MYVPKGTPTSMMGIIEYAEIFKNVSKEVCPSQKRGCLSPNPAKTWIIVPIIDGALAVLSPTY